MSVVIETTIGDLTVDLYLKERPKACLNFLKLCRIKYYNLCIFHKVERNFIAQTGDPTSTGRGGESVFCHLYGDQAKYFDAELKPRLKHEKLGTLSMVNNGNNMNGSQFFLTLGENLTYLDEVHTVLGEVVEGFETLLKINEAICDPNNRPYQDIRITHTVVLHDPYDDPAGLEIPDASPIPTKEQLESGYIGADEEIDDTKGKNVEEIEEKIKESEAKARATILEMVGDLPDADVKPPENVLFVCKLNPVTTSEDLEIIFSRFGTIVSCEVIKDKKSGESLQYAFIEFEKEEDCENAYFKMDNVLIDDRRIHVDFSQSVSKLTWDDKSAKEKGFTRGQNFVIKGNEKKIDGYDMIFDMDNNDFVNSKKDKRRHKARSPDRREERYTSIPDHIEKNPQRRSHHSEQRYHKDKNFDDNQDYSNKRSKYNLSTYKSDKNGRSEKGNIRHISRSPSPISHKKHVSKRSRYQSGSSNKSDSPKTVSSHTPNKKYHRNVRHDSSSSNRSISPLPTQSSQMKRYSSKSIKSSYSSNTSHRKSRRDALPPAQLEKERKHVSSPSGSSSSESPRRPSKKSSSHTMIKSKLPEPANYKKRITKHVTPYSRSRSHSPKSSYQNKRTSKPILSPPKSRSSSRESLSNRKKSKSKQTYSNQRSSSSPESLLSRKKSKSKHSSSKKILSSSPEPIGDRKTSKRPDQSRSRSSGEQRKYEKYQRLETKSKTHSKYSDESSSDRSDSRSRNKKHKMSSSKSQHTAKNKHSHKEQRRRKRSSS